MSNRQPLGGRQVGIAYLGGTGGLIRGGPLRHPPRGVIGHWSKLENETSSGYTVRVKKMERLQPFLGLAPVREVAVPHSNYTISL